ncbi:MAG TPA: glycosyltransferase family 2 protein [Bellilinea sp.]|nr:glycosyltransferase family 2 protein [Bellilinea sp.]
MKLIIQIPCYNESGTLAETLKELPRTLPGVDEITVLIIDDGSTDGTAQTALTSGADLVIRHPSNKGLAQAFQTGLEAALALGADIIVNTDADNQYPGKYIADLVAPVLAGDAEIAIGDRQVRENEHFSPAKRSLESLGSWFVRKFSNTDVPDAPSGFRAYSRYAALRTHVHSSYSYTLETLIHAGNSRMRIAHLPIKTNASTRESRLHKGTWDFIKRQAATIIRAYVLYEPFKTFTLTSVPFFAAGLFLVLRFLYYYLTNQAGVGRYINSTILGGVSILFGLMLFMLGLLADAVKTNRRMIETGILTDRDASRIHPEDKTFKGMQILRK